MGRYKGLAAAFVVWAGLACAGTSPVASGWDERWDELPPLPIPVRAAAAASDGEGRIYVVGGYSASSREAALQILDTESLEWSVGRDLPVATDWGAVTFLSGRLHFVGGVSAGVPASTQHWVYDPSSDQWSSGQPLDLPSAGAAIATLGNRIVVVGGIDGPSSHSAHTRIYDGSSERWSVGPPLGQARINVSGAASDGVLYVVGGGLPGLQTSGSLSAWSASASSWEELIPIPRAREAHGVAAIPPFVCAIGGRRAAPGNRNTPFDDTACYSTVTGAWTPAARLPQALQEVVAVSAGGAIYAIGGRDASGRPVSDVSRLFFR